MANHLTVTNDGNEFRFVRTQTRHCRGCQTLTAGAYVRDLARNGIDGRNEYPCCPKCRDNGTGYECVSDDMCIFVSTDRKTIVYPFDSFPTSAARDFPTRSERILEAGYNAYAREEGHYGE